MATSKNKTSMDLKPNKAKNDFDKRKKQIESN